MLLCLKEKSAAHKNWFEGLVLCHLCTNFEMFGAYLAALMLNFPKHTATFSLSDGFQRSMAMLFGAVYFEKLL